MEPNQPMAEPGATADEDTFVIDTIDNFVSLSFSTSGVFGRRGGCDEGVQP